MGMIPRGFSERVRAQRVRMPAEPVLPSFAMGGRPTKVVSVGSEFAAVYEDTGEVIDHFTCVDPEDAARRAMRAAQPPEEREERDCCVGGCSRCLGTDEVVF